MLDIVEEPLQAGAVIAGKFRLEQPLGQGGMGVVWAARIIANDESVALKFLREGKETDPKSRARFMREARAAMAVVHPHVARVHQVLETDAGVPFIVMERLEGDSLRSVLRRRRSLPLEDVISVFVPITEAVEAAHALGIVHRDLKPENVFLVNGHDVRVLDFGIAKQLARGGDETASTSLTSTGAFIGTPHYMAPEQVFAEDDLDARADIWALGVILYELIAGVRPFEASGVGPLMRRITIDPIRPLSQVVPNVPPAIDALVGRMLSRAKEQRPTLAEVRAVLASTTMPTMPTLSGPTLQDAPRPPSTTIGVASRRPTVTAATKTESHVPMTVAIGAVLALGAIGAGGMVIMKLRKNQTTEAQPGPPPSMTALAPPASITADVPASASAVAENDAAPVPTGHVATAAADNVDHAALARKAFEKGDGATCVREYDLHDQNEKANNRSTNPTNFPAQIRAKCMMLAGDCDGGKKLLFETKRGTSAAEAEQVVDLVAADLCSGTLSQREELLRADMRLASAASGKRRATGAECKKWYDTVASLDGKVTPRTSTDHVRTVRVLLGKNAATCLARAGDCQGSFKLFRDELSRSPGRDAASEYHALTDEIRLCQGTP